MRCGVFLENETRLSIEGQDVGPHLPVSLLFGAFEAPCVRLVQNYDPVAPMGVSEP